MAKAKNYKIINGNANLVRSVELLTTQKLKRKKIRKPFK